MNKIFTFKKIYIGLDEQMITINIPLTVKVCSINSNQNEMNDNVRLTIENIIEHALRYEMCQTILEDIYYHTFSFLRDVYNTIRDDLKLINYNIVDIYIGDETITDEANYILNINKYFENSKY